MSSEPQDMPTPEEVRRLRPTIPARIPPTVGKAVDTLTDQATRRPPYTVPTNEEVAAKKALARCGELVKEMGERYSPARVSLERFECYHPAQRQVLAEVKALADRLPEVVAAGEAVIFYGPVGTGKDHLMAALLHRATGTHGLTAGWLNGIELFGTMRDLIAMNKSEELLLRQFAAPRILAISDPLPPDRELSGWNVETLYRLIDSRYRNLRPTWMTLNAESEEDANEKLRPMVFDRLRESAHQFRCYWPSYRQRQKSKVG
jgi:DNA replication protein DnaC